MKPIFLLIFLILLMLLTLRNNIDYFTNYYKCENKPIRGILKDIFKKYDINKTDSTSTQNINNWDIYLPCGYNKVELELKNIQSENPDKQYIFGISGCDRIVSKNNIWNLLNKKYGREEAKTIMPNTYILRNNLDTNLLKNDYNSHKNYILKKNLQRKQGILISNNYSEIINANDDNYVIAQEMIDSLKINRYKFNIRMYLFVVCKNESTKFYLHEQGKCLYTSKPSINNNNFDENITNSYIMDPNVYKINPQTYKELINYLNKNKNNSGNVLNNNINNIIYKLCYAIKDSLCKLDNVKQNMTFQLFGLDVIVDEKLNPYILEANKGPDMTPKDEIDKKLKTKVEVDMFELIDLIKVNDKNYSNEYKIILSK